jgi:UDP-glucose:(heptosyl)LPS alpha-1,3-glucosyltransferase
MTRKRIAFLKSSILKRGGLEKYTLRLARESALAGHDVFLLTTDYDDGVLEGLPFTVVNLGRRWPLSFLHLLSFDYQCKNYLHSHPMDIVFGMDRNFCFQTHYRAGNGVHAAYLDRRKKECSWFKKCSIALNPLHHLILRMEKKTFESDNLKVLYTNSLMVAKEVQSYYPGVDPKKIYPVHNGVEWRELQTPFEEGLEKRSEIMARLGLDATQFQFLFIGNEYDRKGLCLLLEAMSSLDNQNIELSVVGKERRPESYMAYAKERGLKVHFFGQREETASFYSAADCLVVPSMYDPFANVTVEALAFGLQVISSSSNGGSEVLFSSEMGRIFHNLQNPQELAHCLQEALKAPKNPERAKRIRNSVSHLDFSNQIEKIILGLKL